MRKGKRAAVFVVMLAALAVVAPTAGVAWLNFDQNAAPGWPRTGSTVDPLRIYNRTMDTVTLSVKNVPTELARRLKERATRNHRSLQGELMAIIDEAGHVMTVEDLAGFAKSIGLRTPAESARFARQDRDGRRR